MKNVWLYGYLYAKTASNQTVLWKKRHSHIICILRCTLFIGTTQFMQCVLITYTISVTYFCGNGCPLTSLHLNLMVGNDCTFRILFLQRRKKWRQRRTLKNTNCFESQMTPAFNMADVSCDKPRTGRVTDVIATEGDPQTISGWIHSKRKWRLAKWSSENGREFRTSVINL